MNHDEIAPFLDNSGSEDTEYRTTILGILQRFPAFIEMAKKFSPSESFRVVLSEGNAHLFGKAADGFYKPYLREGSKFVENVDLVKVPPDILGSITDLSMVINMAVIASKLQTIEAGVTNIAKLMANQQRGDLKGHLTALSVARVSSNPAERRAEMVSSSRGVLVSIKTLCAQLGTHIAAMPSRRNSIIESMLDDGLEAASIAYEQVSMDIDLIITGTQELLLSYRDLGEPGMAAQALSGILESLREIDVASAIDKARLVPMPKSGKMTAPEKKLILLGEQINYIEAVLPNLNCNKTPLSIEIRPGELE